MLCEEKRIPYPLRPEEAATRPVGLPKSAASVAIVEAGEARTLLEELSAALPLP